MPSQQEIRDTAHNQKDKVRNRIAAAGAGVIFALLNPQIGEVKLIDNPMENTLSAISPNQTAVAEVVRWYGNYSLVINGGSGETHYFSFDQLGIPEESEILDLQWDGETTIKLIYVSQEDGLAREVTKSNLPRLTETT